MDVRKWSGPLFLGCLDPVRTFVPWMSGPRPDLFVPWMSRPRPDLFVPWMSGPRPDLLCLGCPELVGTFCDLVVQISSGPSYLGCRDLVLTLLQLGCPELVRIFCSLDALTSPGPLNLGG